ncbi:MAG: hypothetical protein HS119_10445 [Flavobacteriales bacterium]|nr:hypothetical protein [Flavobacteriales bacterium]MCL4856609.1 hypothetical protein [Flavobacteriales bacterium]
MIKNKKTEVMGMKENDYLCPKCKGHLNVGGQLVFATETQRKHKGLIMLNPKVGEYDYKHHTKFSLEKGELVEFKCPMCQHNLTAEKNNDHAMILMVGSEDNADYELYFSKKAGNKSTYVVAKDDIKAFGEDAMDIDDLFY